MDSSRLISCFFLAQAHADLGRLDSAAVALDRCEATGTPHPAVAFARVELALQHGDAATATRIADLLVQSGNPVAAEWGHAIHGAIALRHGQFRAAGVSNDAFVEAAQRRGARLMGLVKAFDPARIVLLGDTLSMIRSMDSALARFPLDSLPPLDRPYFDITLGYALAGRPDRAKTFLAQLERINPTAVSVFGVRMLPFLRGSIAQAEGRWDDAIREYRAADSLGCAKCVTPNIAVVYDVSGNADSAIAVYERYVNSTSVDFALFIDQYSLAHAYQRLGALYEAKRDFAKARKYYESFVELWKGADAELQPQVRAVRERLRVIGAQDR